MSVDTELSVIENNMIAAAETSAAPVFVHMLGIPGAGKSSFLKILQEVWDDSNMPKATLLGFDQIMQMISSYQQTDDKVAGFARYEVPARLSGYRILGGLIAKRTNILFDNGGSAESHPDLLRQARDVFGYRLVFISIQIPIAVARARVDLRAVESGQHTPLHYLEERAAKLEKLITIYRTLTPHFYEIDNDHSGFEQFNAYAQQSSSKIVKDLGL